MRLILLILVLCLAGCAKPVRVPPAHVPAISSKLIDVVIEVESNGNPNAVSKGRCIGLMQILPSTGRLLGYTKRELFDPVKNVEAGSRYLEMMLELCKGDLSCALASYNCGYGKRNKSACKRYAQNVLRQL